MDLRERDFARYLSLWLVAPERRVLALALYGLEAELLSIPAKVTQPTVGLMRIVWWRDAVLGLVAGKAKAHPLLQALQAAGNADWQTVADWVETYDVPFIDAAGLGGQLALRYRLEAQLLGQKAASFVKNARRQPSASQISLIFQIIKLRYRGNELRKYLP